MKNKAAHQEGKPSPRVTTDHQLRLYALAAAAASVSTLALAPPAEAEVIITNKTIPIPPNSLVFLDLNGNGVNDFELFLSNYTIDNYSINKFSLLPVTEGAEDVIGGTYSASALLRGAKIGPGGPFIHTSGLGYSIHIEQSTLCTQNCPGKAGYSFDQILRGRWGGNHPNRFLGVRFKINGETHYGWVRMTVTVKTKGDGKGPKGKFSATITEYGYESVANKSCDAGLAGASDAANFDEQPNAGPSLGMLAAGADGLPVWRSGN